MNGNESMVSGWVVILVFVGIALLCLLSTYPPLIKWSIKRENSFKGVKTEITDDAIKLRQIMGVVGFLVSLFMLFFLFKIAS